MIKIAHIVNPVIVNEASDLYSAQPVTFESMWQARNYAAETVDVELFSAQFPEDRALVPEWITPTKDLERSVLDFGSFQHQRKLPLLKDILDRLKESADADYFVYSNVDIALMPYFYTAVSQLINSGHDALVINRRTIEKEPSDPSDIMLMWSQAGEPHPGHDCFVFSRDMLARLNLGNVCLGINWVGRVLLWNLMLHSDNFRLFTDLHLTFHLGDDKAWKDNSLGDYVAHNKSQALTALECLSAEYGDDYVSTKLRDYINDVDLCLENKNMCTHSIFNRLRKRFNLS